jgi:hypothetical protein
MFIFFFACPKKKRTKKRKGKRLRVRFVIEAAEIRCGLINFHGLENDAFIIAGQNKFYAFRMTARPLTCLGVRNHLDFFKKTLELSWLCVVLCI